MSKSLRMRLLLFKYKVAQLLLLVLGIDTFLKYGYFSIPGCDTEFRYRYFSISDHDTYFKESIFFDSSLRYRYISIDTSGNLKFVQAISA